MGAGSIRIAAIAAVALSCAVKATTRLGELAGVIGHKMGHVDLRHSMRRMERANAARTTVGIACVLPGRQPGAAEGAALNVTAATVFAKFARDLPSSPWQPAR
jgi:predicted Zn-dependent protease